MINVLDYGIVADNIAIDNTPAWNNLIANIGADRDIYFPAGIYYFNSCPNIINKVVSVRGCGINATSLIRNFSTTNFDNALFHSTATFNLSGTGILAGTGTSGGSAILLNGLQASASTLRDLYITGQVGGTWAVPLHLKSSDPLGIRSVYIENVELFAATTCIAWMINPKGLTMSNVQGYPAGGTVGHMTIQHSGAIRPSNIDIRTRYLETLYLYNSDNVTITSTPSTVVNQNNCTKVKVY